MLARAPQTPDHNRERDVVRAEQDRCKCRLDYQSESPTLRCRTLRLLTRSSTGWAKGVSRIGVDVPTISILALNEQPRRGNTMAESCQRAVRRLMFDGGFE